MNDCVCVFERKYQLLKKEYRMREEESKRTTFISNLITVHSYLF